MALRRKFLLSLLTLPEAAIRSGSSSARAGGKGFIWRMTVLDRDVAFAQIKTEKLEWKCSRPLNGP